MYWHPTLGILRVKVITDIPRPHILVLNFNGASDTIECVESILSDSWIRESDITVVDNGSNDDSASRIRQSLPGIQVLMVGENLGYAGGLNFAIRSLLSQDTKSFLLMNNDTIIHKDSIRLMSEDLEEHTDIGIVGPAIIGKGTNVIQSLGASIDWYKGETVGRMIGLAYSEVAHSIEEVNYVSGCAMLIRKEVFDKVGMLAQHFFMYGEEADLCLRASKTRFRVVCDSRAVVEHKVGATADKYPEMRARFLTRNKFLFMKRHSDMLQFLSFAAWTFFADLPFRSLLDLNQGYGLSVPISRLSGILEGLILSASEPRILSEGTHNLDKK